MYRVLDSTVPYLPQDKPVYLMGVGTPLNIVEGVYRGVDFFDCTADMGMPTRTMGRSIC